VATNALYDDIIATVPGPKLPVRESDPGEPMSCQICGRRSAPGAKLCVDCRAARKRAFDATITQPLMAMAGAGTVSRTLARLRRAEASPEAKARRAARKAKAAAESAALPVVAPPAAGKSAGSRPLLWILLSIGVVLAAVAGWHLPSRTPAAPGTDADSVARPSAPPQGGVKSPPTEPVETTPAAALPPLPTIVERELVPHAPAAGRPATPKRVAPAPKPAAQPEAPAEIEVVRAPPAAPAPPAPKPAPQADPWQQMSAAIGRCPDGFLGHVVCEQRIRLQYCEGHWGQVAQCPGGPSAESD